MKRRWKLLGSLAVLVALTACQSSTGASPTGSAGDAAAATSGSAAAGSVAAGAGGDLSVAVFSETKGFDPAVVDAGNSGGDRADAVFDTLVALDASGEVTDAGLARSMTSPDGMVWTLVLHPDVLFTDGTPLDAEAVKFNLERHIAPDSVSTAKGYLAAIDSMTVVDPLTLTITLKQPQRSFPVILGPSTTAGFIGSPTAIRQDPAGFNDHPVGAGPFVLKEWNRDDSVVLTRNPGYWRTDEPKLESLTFRVMTDPQSRADALRSGAVDLAYLLPATSLTELGAPDYHVLSEGSPGGFGIALNMQKAPGDDLRIRQAVQLAFDPTVTNNVFFTGLDVWDGRTDCLPFAQDAQECQAPQSPAPDQAKAKALVAEYVAEGKSPAIDLIGTPNYQTQLEYVQQTLNSIGLEVNLVTSPTAEWVTKISQGDYSGTLMVTVPFLSFFPSTYYLLSQKGRNYPKQQDAAFEQALSTAINADTSDARLAGWKDAQTIFNQEAIATWIAPFTNFWVTSSRLDLGDYVGGQRFDWASISVN